MKFQAALIIFKRICFDPSRTFINLDVRLIKVLLGSKREAHIFIGQFFFVRFDLLFYSLSVLVGLILKFLFQFQSGFSALTDRL